ncbi:response regulator [Aliikangiella sp. IMCC44653]
MTAKILVVEDDFANQRVASLFLKKLGYESDIAENGQQAINILENETYQLVFMDCQMPVMDGFEAARQIRNLTNDNRDIPIVALTANVVSGIVEDCKQAGMNDVLNKPIQLQTIKDMLDNWLN